MGLSRNGSVPINSTRSKIVLFQMRYILSPFSLLRATYGPKIKTCITGPSCVLNFTAIKGPSGGESGQFRGTITVDVVVHPTTAGWAVWRPFFCFARARRVRRARQKPEQKQDHCIAFGQQVRATGLQAESAAQRHAGAQLGPGGREGSENYGDSRPLGTLLRTGAAG